MRTFQLGRGATTPATEDETADAVESPGNDARTDRTDAAENSVPETAPETAPAAAPEVEPALSGLPAAPPVRSGSPDGDDGSRPDGVDGSGPPAEDGPAPSTAVRRGVLAAFALMLVAAVVTGVMWNGGRSAEADRQAAMESAQQAAVNLTSINFETADQDVRRVIEESTGDFGGLFSQNLDSYISLVKESKIKTRGEVTGAGIDRIDGSTARIVVAVKADVSNQSVPNGEQRFYRMVTELEKKNGDWLVSRVEFVP